jgi:hypothetical protein
MTHKIPVTAYNLGTPTIRDWWRARKTPTGAMAAYIGRRYTSKEIGRAYEEHVPGARAVRAFEVPSLIGHRFAVTSPSQVQSVIRQTLTENLPGIEWDVPSDWAGPLLKYQLLHKSIPAPPDEATGQPMALELFAEMVQIDGLPVDSGPGTERIERYREAYRQASSSDAELPPLEGYMLFEVRAATYSNVMYPGAGVPFYL